MCVATRARALRGKQTGNAEAVAKIKERAKRRATDLMGIIEGINRAAITSVRAVTEELNRQGIKAPRGGGLASNSLGAPAQSSSEPLNRGR